MTQPDLIAALDLGSNSFHMVVARALEGDQLQVLDQLKIRVRLAAGLDEGGHLSAEAQDRAIEALEHFGQRVRDMPRGSVRAVATNTLRRSRSPLPFLVRAHRALGHPIEVISGREEARLIYQGVARDAVAEGRRLVVDIGGGSTELIVGEGLDPLLLDSLYMGCVSWSLRFFPGGRITAAGMEAAVTAARLELEAVERRYRGLGWASAVGSSGTIKAISRTLIAQGLDPRAIRSEGLEHLRRSLVAAGHSEALSLPGVSAQRRPVFPGGVAILSAVFEALEIRSMLATRAALREGLLYDLLGRRTGDDTREATISRFAERLRVDRAQARRVERTALGLFDQVSSTWELSQDHRMVLGWAARLHEVGVFLTYSGYHKHGAYLVAHSDLPGFSQQAQGALAALILSHRGRLDSQRMAQYYPAPSRKLLQTAALLRLAVRLHRGRSPKGAPELRLRAEGEALSLRFPEGWLARHPMTRADLETEAATLLAAGFTLTSS